MAVKDFDKFVKESRERFREDLKYSTRFVGEFTDTMRGMFNECTNNFEEQTLMENLREEFQDYMETLTKGA